MLLNKLEQEGISKQPNEKLIDLYHASLGEVTSQYIVQTLVISDVWFRP
jgi:hypothetical protein